MAWRWRHNPPIEHEPLGGAGERWTIPGLLTATIAVKRLRPEGRKRLRRYRVLEVESAKLKGRGEARSFGIEAGGVPVGVPTRFKRVTEARKALKAFVRSHIEGGLQIAKRLPSFVAAQGPFRVDGHTYTDARDAYGAAHELYDLGAPLNVRDGDGRKLSLLELRMTAHRAKGAPSDPEAFEFGALAPRETAPLPPWVARTPRHRRRFAGRRGERRARRARAFLPARRRGRERKACGPDGILVRAYAVKEHWRACPRARSMEGARPNGERGCPMAYRRRKSSSRRRRSASSSYRRKGRSSGRRSYRRKSGTRKATSRKALAKARSSYKKAIAKARSRYKAAMRSARKGR